MLAKRLFQKATARHRHHQRRSPENVGSCLASSDVYLRVILHYGVPSTASILAFDPIQHLLAIGTLDGRIKVIGGDNVEYLFVSLEKLPYKYLEFIHNEGYLTSITTDNSIEVWDLKRRCRACSFHWESNITAFSMISGSSFMYVGDEYGVVSVVQYDAEKVELLHLPYQISSETAGYPLLVHQPVVGVLPQPCSSGTRKIPQLLIAYECGLIILWDIYKAQIVVVKGDNVLQLKNKVDSPSCVDSTLIGNVSPQSKEKEISAVCWASSDGSVLAVGYVDGDVLFWKTCLPGKNQRSALSDNVVKLQLSPAEKRLPVIVLHWWANHKSHRNGDGQLLIYGGDEIGSDEVLTVLNLEWSSGMESVQCLNRMEVSLSGSFADVAITSGAMGSDKNISLFILTNPGRLQIFDIVSLCASVPEREKKMSVSPVDFPPVILTINPLVTVASLFCLPTNGDLSKGLAEVDLFKKFSLKHKMSEGKRWPLTGGECNYLSSDKEYHILRLYIAGYQDGSVQMWDATYPVLSFLCKLESEIRGVNVAISVASVSKLEFCVHTLRLAVGYECGLVRIYELICSDERSFHFVTESTHEVKLLADDGFNCRAAFSFFNSQVQALKFTNSGAKLATGYSCGHIVVLDMHTFSAMFVTDIVSSPISIYDVVLDGLANDSNKYGSKDANDQCKNSMFVFTKDGAICIIDADSGNFISPRPRRLSKDTTAVSMHVIESSSRGPRALSERWKKQLCKDETVGSQPAQDIMTNVDNKSEAQSLDNESSGQHLDELFVLLCFEDIIRVYAAKSIVQGDRKTICKVRLTKPCCWTTTFMKDGILCGLVLLYNTGDLEIRSLPNLELVKENSLTSVLRWNFNANVERMMTSTNNGHIALVYGSELAFLSVVSNENDFRIPESLPNLHDEVLAAAAKAAISYCLKHKKKKGGGGGIFHGLVKGFKREKVNLPWDLACSLESLSSQLKDIFMRNSTLGPPAISNDTELNIDDIEIDEPVNLEPTSSHGVRHKTDNKKDREKLFNDEASGSGIKPRLRTREEILATYRQAGDASSVAGQARNKLLERQEKLKRMSKQTEELNSEAENFASLANELLKVIENRKWWQI